MTCPRDDRWHLLSMDLLTEMEAAGLRRHAQDCDRCERVWRAARQDHATLLRASEVFERDHDEQREWLMTRLAAETETPGLVRRSLGDHRGLGGIVMKLRRHKGRLAALALLPAAAIVLVILMTGPRVAFASVLERMRQARTMTCDVALTTQVEFDPKLVEQLGPDGAPRPDELAHTTRGTLTMYSDGQKRAWLLDQTDPPERQLTLPDRMIVTRDGKNSVTRLTNDPDTPGYVESPETWLQRLLALADAPDRALGTAELDGREVLRFEIAASRLDMGVGPLTDDPGSVVRMWVDVETRLPVRLEFDVVRHVGPTIWKLSGAWDHMRWNVPVNPAEFDAHTMTMDVLVSSGDVPVNPAEFEPPEIGEGDEVTDLALGPANEETLLAGLRLYAEQTAQIRELLAAAEQKAEAEPGGAELLANVRQWIAADQGYPPALDLQSVSMTGSMRASFARARVLAERARRAAAEHDGVTPSAEEQRLRETQEQQLRAEEDHRLKSENDRLMRALGGAALFYRQLTVDGREPEYFGTTVQPGDGQAVLLRWKLDDGGMRVVYGDLRAESLPAER